MIVREKSKLQLYAGQDPIGNGGVIRVLIGKMTQAQLRAWMKQDPATASKHIYSDDTTSSKTAPNKTKQKATAPEEPSNDTSLGGTDGQ